MSYSAPHEEETLSTYFDKNQPAPGGDTSQLRAACDFLQQLIVQELWCVQAGIALSVGASLNELVGGHAHHLCA